ncbi:MAG: hypothetical protein J2P31_02170, partial [Blastocatellia bacterium]|nr:hypothetical protein [Blastocatellia bacterium]
MLLYLFILILALVPITLIGHGIWVLLQTIFRSPSGASPADSSYKFQGKFQGKCQVCNTSLPPRTNYCGFCGSKQVAHEAIPADLDFIVRQLERMRSLGRIDQITYDSILRAIEEDRVRFKSPEAPQIEKIEKIEKTSLPPQPVAIEIASLPTTAEPTAPVNSPPAASIVERPMHERPERPVESKTVQVREDFPRSFAEVLASFMEERSIQWGELIGGLLIVGCSIALVISLWAKISEYPFLKFIVFAGMTSGLFGLGFYSAHRWKLPTSSRGVLIISTMLVPLNFLAISAFSSNELPASLPVIVGELAALALFMFFVYQAARVILPRCEWLLVCAVLGPSFTMLLAPHLSPPDDAMRQSILLGILPLVCYWVSTGSVLRYFKNDSVSPAHHFTLLGIASFSALMPFILLIVNNPSYTATLYSPLIAFFGVPAMVAGLANLNRTGEELSGGMRTLATSVSFLGALGPLAALAIAWPIPVSLLFVALINCVICYALVFAYGQLKPFHLLALAHLLLSYLIGVNLAANNISLWAEDAPRLLASLVSTSSAYSLVFFFSLLAVAAEALRKAESSKGEGKPEAALQSYYGVAAAVVGTLGLALITIHGFGRAGDPRFAVPIYAYYSLAAFIIAWRRNIRIAAWVACALALIAVFQAMVFKYAAALSPYHPVTLSMLAGASVAAVAAVSLRGERARRLFRIPLTASSLFSSAIAAVAVLLVDRLANTEISVGMLWLALIWALLAWFNRWRGLFSVFQAALALSVVIGTDAIIVNRFAHSPHALSIDALRLQAQGIALALLSFAWLLVRLYLRIAYKNEADQQAEAPLLLKLLSPPWPAIDRITIALPLLLLFMLSLASLFPFLGVFEREAAGAGSWMLALFLAVVLLTGLWVRFSQISVLALIVIFSCITMLQAGRGGMLNVSTGTAFYWFVSLGFLIVSLPILFRDRVSRICEIFGWPDLKARTAGLANSARNMALILFAAPVLLTKPLLFLGEIVLEESDFTALGSVASLVIPLLVISLTLAAHAIRESSTGFAVSSSIILNLAVTMGVLLGVHDTFWDTLWPLRIAHLNILATSIAALVWFAAVRFRLDSARFRQGWFGCEPHQFLASLSLFLSFVVSLFHLRAIIQSPGSLSGTAPSGWLAVASFMILMAACLWDSQYKFAVPGLLLSGFLLIFLLLSDLDGENLGIAAAILLASYGLALGIIWRRRGALALL